MDALKGIINRIQHNSDQVSYYINGWRNGNIENIGTRRYVGTYIPALGDHSMLFICLCNLIVSAVFLRIRRLRNSTPTENAIAK